MPKVRLTNAQLLKIKEDHEGIIQKLTSENFRLSKIIDNQINKNNTHVENLDKKIRDLITEKINDIIPVLKESIHESIIKINEKNTYDFCIDYLNNHQIPQAKNQKPKK